MNNSNKQISGKGKVDNINQSTKQGMFGATLSEGRIDKDMDVQVFRAGQSIYTGRADALQYGNKDAKEITSGQNFSIQIKDFNPQAGDIMEWYSRDNQSAQPLQSGRSSGKVDASKQSQTTVHNSTGQSQNQKDSQIPNRNI